jgi:glucose uptake protein GlcU
MRHEHQMFFGFIPILLALYGFFIYTRQQKKSHEFSLIAALIPILFLITLSIGGLSFWFFLHKLPLFSAIRAITRIDQAMLFPLGYLAMLAVNEIETKPNVHKIIWLAIIPFMLTEYSFVIMATSHKSDWRSRILRLEKILPREIPNEKVLFFASRGEVFYADTETVALASS